MSREIQNAWIFRRTSDFSKKQEPNNVNCRGAANDMLPSPFSPRRGGQREGVNGVKAAPPLIYISKRQSGELAYVNGVGGFVSQPGMKRIPKSVR